MQESMEQKLARAQAELEATEAAVARIESGLRTATESVTSRDRSVEATVGPQGNLTGLNFLDNKYRTMSASALSAVVVETVERARERMARKVVTAFEPLAGDISGPSGLGQLDLAQMLGVSPDEPRTARKRSAKPLHDELHEDL